LVAGGAGLSAGPVEAWSDSPAVWGQSDALEDEEPSGVLVYEVPNGEPVDDEVPTFEPVVLFFEHEVHFFRDVEPEPAQREPRTESGRVLELKLF
jgi:hypothetical protein